MAGVCVGRGGGVGGLLVHKRVGLSHPLVHLEF